MKKQILTITMVAITLLTACNQKMKKDKVEKTNAEKMEKANGNIVNQSLSDQDGNELSMTFNNTKDIVTIEYKGEKSQLTSKRPASGIWYANDHYELRGKGNNITLKKEGKIVFKN